MNEEMLIALAEELSLRQQWEDALWAEIEQMPLKMAA